jgi:membrane protein implicated in regulation of membrane protease activity
MVKHGTALAYVLVLLALTLVLLAGPTSARMTLLIVLIAALAAYAALLGWRVLRRRARR